MATRMLEVIIAIVIKERVDSSEYVVDEVWALP